MSVVVNKSGYQPINTTDGVHDFIDEKTIRQLLQEGTDLTKTADCILQQAISHKSDDNLTCQLIRIDTLPEAKEDEIIRRHSNLPFPPLLEPGMIIDDYAYRGRTACQ